MVNSGSFESDSPANCKNDSDNIIAPDDDGPTQANFPCQFENEFPTQATAKAIEPTATRTDNLAVVTPCAPENAKLSTGGGILCRLPLALVQDALRSYLTANSKCMDSIKPGSKKAICLFCERTFGSVTLRQKHVDRCHSMKYNRRLSVRIQSDRQTACVYCTKLDGTSYTLDQLFEHLVSAHPTQYFACWDCQERFPSSQLLENHLNVFHKTPRATPSKSSPEATKSNKEATPLTTKPHSRVLRTSEPSNSSKSSPDTRLRNRFNRVEQSKVKSKSASKKAPLSSGKLSHIRELRSKKVTIISTKVRTKQVVRVTRQQAKVQINMKKARKGAKTKKNEDANQKSASSCINPYPTFDINYRVKKITDHSIDNLKIASMTFDDVFDKAFYNRVKCNIRDNLLNHIDGKLFKSIESENRISSFQKCSDVQSDMFNQTYGCEISSNAIAPVASLLSGSQFGEDLESQIEYGTKASKKKPMTSNKDDEVHYKYFTRRKYQEAIKESQKHRDLSKLDMWTQLAVKNRQEELISLQKTPKEMIEYTRSDEYKTKLQVEELNEILDKRGPVEDLKAEAIRAGVLTMMNGDSDESCLEVTLVLNDILNKVCAAEEFVAVQIPKTEVVVDATTPTEIPDFLNLQRVSPHLPTPESNAEIMELTGEWARSRVYVCASCAEKTPAMNKLIDHKYLAHPHVWCQHYEFVGNQEELCEHLSIPVLGKVGELEKGKLKILCQKSEARVCSKCRRECSCLNELHRHMLDCGGDWTWIMERKKYKYRYYGSKPRKKRCEYPFCVSSPL